MDKKAADAERKKKLSKYLEHLCELLDNVDEDLRVISGSLTEVKSELTAAARESGDVNWIALSQKISRILESCMPHTGVSLSSFLLEVNSRVSNVPLLLQDPMRDLTAKETEADQP